LKNFILKNRTIINNVVALLLVLSVPFVVSICLLQYTVHFAMNQCEERSYAEIEHMQELVERNLSVIRKQAMEIAQSRKLLQLEKYDPNNKADVYAVSNLAQELRTLAGTQEFCRGFYVYSEAADIIFFNGSKFTSRRFFDTYVKKGHYETWKSMLGREYLNVCRNSQGNINDMSEYGVVEYLQSYPLGGKNSGTIVFLLDKSVFMTKSITPKNKNSKLELYVFNQNNELVHTTGKINDSDIESLLKVSDGSSHINTKERAFVFSATSDSGKLRYICVDRGSAAFKIIEKISLFIFIYAIIIFLGGGLYIFSTTYQMSKRIKRINKLISIRGNHEPVLDWNVVLSGIEDLANNQSTMNNIISAKNNIERNMVLVNFLYDYTSSAEQYLKTLENHGIVFDAQSYISVLGVLEMSAAENTNLLKFAVQNIFSDLIGEKASWYFVDCNWNRVMFLLKGTFGEAEKQEISMIYQSVSEYMLSILNIKTEFVIGEICEEVESLRASAKKLNERYRYKTLYGNNFENKTDMAGYKYLQKQENELINLMFSGSGEDVDGFVRDIISAHKDTSHVVMNTLYYNLLGTFFKCADRAGIKESFNSHELENIIYENDIAKIEENIRNLFAELSDRITKTDKKGKLSALSVKLVSYVDANYTDSNLSLKMISSEFGITVSYISKVFKEQFGTNFSDYITNMRVEKAKQLLKTTNMSMGEIAQNLGYVDSSIFIKNFKKITGKTPGVYRDTNS